MERENIIIEDVMHPFPHAIGDHETLHVAKEMMTEYGIRHLPVQRGGQLLGILSDRDINYVLASEKKAIDRIPIKDSYTEDPYIVEPHVPLRRVANRMAEERIGCALIAQDDKLLGIFTTVDACRTLADLLNHKELGEVQSL